jgi:AcrR family transcriptional regulator
MTSDRRIGSEDSATRGALLDAALRLMIDEGYAAVTSRRIAAQAGLKPQLVHYYFRTMDDLFVALIRRGAEQNLERQAEVFASPQPLRALWEYSSDPRGTALAIEFAALANHRKAIRGEFATYAEQFRRLQSEALATVLTGYGIDEDEFPPEIVHVVVTAISQVLALEETLGVTAGHAGTRALVERYLIRYEGEPAQAPAAEPER